MVTPYTDGGNPTPRQLRKLLKSFSRELREQPDDMMLRLKIAEVLRLLCRYNEAVQVYRTVAWHHAINGNLVQAIMLCKLILDLSPDHKDTQEMLAKLYASKRVRDGKQSVIVRRVGQRWVADPSREVRPADEAAVMLTGPLQPKPAARPSASSSLDDEALRRRLPAVPPLREKLEATHVEVADQRPTIPPSPLTPEQKALAKAESEITVNLRKPKPREDEKAPTIDSTVEDVRRFGSRQVDATDTDPSFSVRSKRRTMPYSTPQTPRARTRMNRPTEPPPDHQRPARTTTPMSNETLQRVVRSDAELSYNDEQNRVTECHEQIKRRVRHEGCAQSEEPAGDLSSEIDLSETVKEGYAGKSSLPASHQIPVLPLFSDLDMAAFIALINRLERRYFPSGTIVLREGDPGDSLMLVGAGKLQVFKVQDGREIELARLGPGSFFGEFALLADQRRHASVRTVSDCELLELRWEMLAGLVREHPSVGTTLETFYRQRVLEMVLATSPLFQAVSPEERERVVSLFSPRRFLPGEAIVEEGRKSSFYVILLGGVTVSCKGDEGEEIEVATLTEGDYFGEMSLISGDAAEATVVAKRTTDTLMLDARSFYELAAVHPEIWAEVQRECEARREVNERLRAARKAGALLL